jgi:hypothetical protein
MASYSCTNQRYEDAPLRQATIDILPKGTKIYRLIDNHPSPGDPVIFTFIPDLFPKTKAYRLKEDLLYLIGLPQGNPVEGLCWECQPDEVFCYSDDLQEQIPTPCAWFQEPFLYLCRVDTHLLQPL